MGIFGDPYMEIFGVSHLQRGNECSGHVTIDNENDVKYWMLPNDDVKYWMLPNDDVKYWMLPNGDVKYWMLPNDDVKYWKVRNDEIYILFLYHCN